MSMTAAQYARLAAIQSRLFDVLGDECDPDCWPGAGIAPTAWDRDTRGDRYWHKKNAAATMSLITRAQSIFKAELDNARRGSGAETDDDNPMLEPAEVTPGFDIDKDIARFEAQAMRAIEAAAARK